MAHAVFESHVSTNSLLPSKISRVDSCGTGAYHTGSLSDPRTLSTLTSQGIPNFRHPARKLRVSDFDEFDYIFAMDNSNLDDIERLRERSKKGNDKGKARVGLFGEWGARNKGDSVDGHEVVEDPYYGGRNGFEEVYKQVDRMSVNFLRELGLVV
jgi:low molecular weight phosphotyrosine protein phosphatase